MVSHLGFGLGNAEVLSGLVLNNIFLLETIVNKESVQTFLDLIKNKGPQERFVNFLDALCSYKQQDSSRRGITQNQEVSARARAKQESGEMLTLAPHYPPPPSS